MIKEAKNSTGDEKLKSGIDFLSQGLFKAERILIYAGVLLVVLMLGFFAAWVLGREVRAERDAAKQELRISQLQNKLANSMVNARTGEYEQARAGASDFFTGLRTEIDRGEENVFNDRQREQTQPMLAQRDEIITLLARSDPASVSRLTDLYISYMQMIGSTPPQ